ncbi:MAG: competence/damage-inducible protein A [Chloroflexi bacterium]|nr:competence/damage-inducible protein A [Chloroflexota bacterium]PKB57681.1 MAG: competence/damage-inducible protein A [SAR202 cluster bacterium Casp-Chloro-G3]
MKAEIFSIGTELLMGELTDTNGSWISAQLPALGIQMQWLSIIGDDLNMLAEAFQRGLQRSDIIFTTGGLGPTQDDLTREAVAKALGETPVVQQEVVDNLEKYFQGRGMVMPPRNIKQAHLIPSAQFILNPNGTAPGWWSEQNGKIIVNMPGPPGEMHPMWENQVAPRLRQIVNDEVTITRNIKTLGMSEAAVDEVISEFFGKENPYLGIYSKADGIHLRVIARAKDEASARNMIQPVEDAIVDRLGPYIWGYDDETPEESAGQALHEQGQTLATMESCTGGFLANSITDVAHSSSYYKGGVVAYTNQLKIASGVPAEIIEKHGASSAETAEAMAKAIREKLGADFGIGITGVAGPDSLEGKPAGQIYIAIAGPDEVKGFEMRVPPRRIVIKRRASNTALTELRKMITAMVGAKQA